MINDYSPVFELMTPSPPPVVKTSSVLPTSIAA